MPFRREIPLLLKHDAAQPAGKVLKFCDRGQEVLFYWSFLRFERRVSVQFVLRAVGALGDAHLRYG
ncbi:MAG: hypothetical protein WBY84_11675, partial [Pseudolabrys sp.]